MKFRELSNRVLEPLSMWTMVVGIIALCQPWIEIVHRYGVTVILVGLVGFIVFSHVQPTSETDG